MSVSTNSSVANGYTDLSGSQVSNGAEGVAGVTPSGTLLTENGFVVPQFSSIAAASKIFGVGSGGTAISLGTTMVTQHPAEWDFVGVQLLYENQSASSYTVTKARVASTATHQDIANTSTWYDVTFSGSASGTVAASPSGAGSDTQGSFLLSDFVPVISVARTDNTAKTPLLQARSYFAAAANGLSVGAGDIAAWNAGIASYDRQYAARAPAGDVTATFTASQQPLEAGTWIVPASVLFHYTKDVRTLLICGDSLSKGHLTTGGATSWPAILTGILRQNNKRYAAHNLAWTGQTLAASIVRSKAAISILKPDYAVIFSWSPNDAAAGSVTQATFDAGYSRALEHVSWCRRNGVEPILCTSGPWNALSGAQNTIRRANNARILALRSYGIRVFDFASVLEDPSNNAQILPAYNQGDGLHYNDAGHLAMATLAANQF
jgi:lysophospholipase L1-like esterase